MDELAKKKKVRGAHKASATKIIQQVNELVRSKHPNHTKLSCLKLTLKEKFETIKALDDEVIKLIDGNGIVEDIERADEFKETVFNSFLSIDRLMERLRPMSVVTTTDVRDSDTHTPPTHSRVKLPKFHLRSFSGNLTQWTSFWDSYQTAIHNNEQLTDIII